MDPSLPSKVPVNAYEGKMDPAEQMAMKLANPETKKFENYLSKVMNSVKNRKRMSLAPEASDPMVNELMSMP